MEPFFKDLIGVLPKLKNKFGLIGLIVAVGGFVITRRLAPDSLATQFATGSVGITLVVFGQVFFFLNLIPTNQRAKLIIVLFSMFCLFMVTQLSIASYLIYNNVMRVPDSISIEIPGGWTFKQVARLIAERENMTIDAKSCPEEFLNAEVEKGSIQAKNAAIALETLSLRISGQSKQYQVVTHQERGVYEIVCK